MVQHEDKCRWWDDEEFCDCGAVECDRPEKEIAALQTELALTRKALDGAVQTERARCLSVVERELGRSPSNAETALDHVYAAIENG